MRLLLLFLAASLPSTAEPLCDLWRHQLEVSIDASRLDVALAETELAATEEIHHLIDQLWKNDAIAEVPWRTARHARDVARLELKARQLLLKRFESERTFIDAACDGESVAASRARYEQADCHRLGKRLAIAEVDLEYHRALLASARVLREGSVATRQDIIVSERNVARSEARVAHYRPIVAACATPAP